jgi:hypothetical protein
MSFEEKLAYMQKLQGQVVSLANMVGAKEKNLAEKESQIRQGQIPNNGPQDLEKNMRRNLGPMLAPGNLGDINKVIWPYYFSTEVPDAGISLDQTFQTGFSVTQEAAFIMMSFTKTVYVDNGAGNWVYLNPNDESNIINQAPNLTFTMRDGSSSRQFYNQPMQMQNYGNPRFPTKLPRPIMLLPNQVMQVSFVNSHPSVSYVPMMTFFGYRMRIEDAQNFLSLVYG